MVESFDEIRGVVQWVSMQAWGQPRQNQHDTWCSLTRTDSAQSVREWHFRESREKFLMMWGEEREGWNQDGRWWRWRYMYRRWWDRMSVISVIHSVYDGNPNPGIVRTSSTNNQHMRINRFALISIRNFGQRSAMLVEFVYISVHLFSRVMCIHVYNSSCLPSLGALCHHSCPNFTSRKTFPLV